MQNRKAFQLKDLQELDIAQQLRMMDDQKQEILTENPFDDNGTIDEVYSNEEEDANTITNNAL